MRAVAFADRLEGGIAAGDGARMGHRHRRARLGARDLEHDDRHVLRRGLVERRDEARGIAHRLEEQHDDAGARQIERIVKIVGRGGGDLLAGRDHQVEAEPLAAVEDRAEHRARMRDEGDRPRVAVVGPEGIAGDAHLALEVHEAHAVAATDLNAGLACAMLEPVQQRRVAVVRHVAIGQDGRRAGAALDGQRELCLEAVAADAEHGVIDRFGQIGERGQAGDAVDLVVFRVDRENLAVEAAAAQLDDQLVADAGRGRRGADDGDRARRQQRREAMIVDQGGSVSPTANFRDRRRMIHDAASRPLSDLRRVSHASTANRPSLAGSPPER